MAAAIIIVMLSAFTGLFTVNSCERTLDRAIIAINFLTTQRADLGHYNYMSARD